MRGRRFTSENVQPSNIARSLNKELGSNLFAADIFNAAARMGIKPHRFEGRLCFTAAEVKSIRDNVREQTIPELSRTPDLKALLRGYSDDELLRDLAETKTELVRRGYDIVINASKRFEI